MIPLRDSEATHRLAPANTILILANIAVFAFEVKLGRYANAMFVRYAMVPAHVAHLRLATPRRALESVATIFTATFIHAGFFHIAGNMLYLFIFGPAVELLPETEFIASQISQRKSALLLRIRIAWMGELGRRSRCRTREL